MRKDPDYPSESKRKLSNYFRSTRVMDQNANQETVSENLSRKGKIILPPIRKSLKGSQY